MDQNTKESPTTNRDKLLLSNIERFINRKIDVSVHQVKQLTCKNENVNKFDLPAAKKHRIEQQKLIRLELKAELEKEK